MIPGDYLTRQLTSIIDGFVYYSNRLSLGHNDGAESFRQSFSELVELRDEMKELWPVSDMEEACAVVLDQVEDWIRTQGASPFVFPGEEWTGTLRRWSERKQKRSCLRLSSWPQIVIMPGMTQLPKTKIPPPRLRTRPPNFRKTTNAKENCHTCKSVNRATGYCARYGYPVKSDDVCNSWQPRTDGQP